MKSLLLILSLTFSMGAVFAQLPFEGLPGHDEWIKLKWQEKRAFRLDRDKAYKDWEKKYFNSPGDWYISVEAGYGWPYQTIESEAVRPFTFLGKTMYEEYVGGSKSEEVILSSTGEGQRLGISAGVMFNRFLGLEVQLGYIDEKVLTLSSIKTPRFSSVLNADLFETYADPLLVLQSPNLNNFYLYGKIGPHIPIWGSPRADSRIDDREGVLLYGLLDEPLQSIAEAFLGQEITQELLELVDYHAVLTADVRIYLQQDPKYYPFKEILRGVGVNAGAGFRYQASPIVSVFGEINVIGFNVSLAQTIIEDMDARVTLFGEAFTLLHLTEEGGTMLGMQITKESMKSLLETIYRNELTEESNNPLLNPDGFNPWNPREELAARLNVVSVGINVGIQVNFPGRGVYYRERSRKAR